MHCFKTKMLLSSYERDDWHNSRIHRNNGNNERTRPWCLFVTRKAVHRLHGFDELGGTDDVATETLAYILGSHGVLAPRDDEVPPSEDITGDSVNVIRIHETDIRDGLHDNCYDDEDENMARCY
jgi:hypothetical protein